MLIYNAKSSRFVSFVQHWHCIEKRKRKKEKKEKKAKTFMMQHEIKKKEIKK